MIEGLAGFVALLRTRGLAVGTDATITAARCLNLIDLADRTTVQRALRAVLVTSRYDEEAFDRSFAEWFSGRWAAQDVRLPEFSATAGEPATPDAHLALETERRLQDASYVDDPSERIGVTTDRGEPQGGSATPVEAESGTPIRPQIDASSMVTDRSTTEDDVGADRIAGSPSSIISLPDAPEGTEQDVDAELESLRTRLAQAAEQHHLPDIEVEDEPMAPSAASLAARARLANPFDADETRELEIIVRGLRSQLHGAPAWRSRGHPAGQIDLRRTLRAAVTTGGVAAQLRRRAPRADRLRMLVVVDASLSVRPTARLTLHLAHRLGARSARVQVLAFVDRCVDVTSVVRHADVAEALGRLLDDEPGGPLDPARSSDYGAAFRSLWTRYAAMVTPHTTVLILGDGRSNGRDPHVQAVRDLRRRAHAVFWLTPEAEGAWGFGHGEMRAYANEVTAAATVRTLDDLRWLVDSDGFSGTSSLRPPPRDAPGRDRPAPPLSLPRPENRRVTR